MYFKEWVNQYIQEEHIEGGLASGKSVADIAAKWGVDVKTINKVLEVGAKVEMEHTPYVEVAREIAMDHLMELGPKYYDALDKMEKKVEKENEEEEEKNKEGIGV